MLCWIDIITPPDVYLFERISRKLEDKGFDVLITVRDYAETLGLAERLLDDFVPIGRYGGRDLAERLIARVERTLELAKLIGRAKDRPDVLLTRHSSPAIHVAFGLGIPVVHLLDDVHARAQCRLTLPFSDVVITPALSRDYDLESLGANPSSLRFFDGVFEIIYIEDYEPDRGVLEELGVEEGSYIVARPEPVSSFVDRSKENILVPILKELARETDLDIVVLPRFEFQREIYRRELGSRAIIPDKPVDGPSLIYFSRLLLGAGGTMNREAACMGVPVVNCFPGPLPVSDRYFVEKGLEFRILDREGIVKKSLELLEGWREFRKRAEEVRMNIENPLELIISEVEILCSNR